MRHFSSSIIVFLAGCATAGISSYTDPAYKAPPLFKSVVVMVDNMNLDSKKLFEEKIKKEMQKKGVEVFISLDLLPPTRQHSDQDIVNAVESTKADSVLIVTFLKEEIDDRCPAEGPCYFKRYLYFEARLIDHKNNATAWLSNFDLFGAEEFSSNKQLYSAGARKIVRQLSTDGMIARN